MTTPHLVRLLGAGKTYHRPMHVTALHAVDLGLTAGETVAVTGPSGSGKSTLLSLLGTLERPSIGEVRIAGVPTTRLS